MIITTKQQNIIYEVHDYVKKQSEGFSELDDVFENHILGVVRFSEKLADLYKADKFVVLIAAYLHDISYIQTKDHETHEIEESQFVKKYLKKFDISKEDIEKVSMCILHHRGSKSSERKTIEEKIIACADAMDHIDRCLQMFYKKIAANTYEESMEFMKGKLARGWKKIELPKARALVKKKYEAAKVLFGF